MIEASLPLRVETQAPIHSLDGMSRMPQPAWPPMHRSGVGAWARDGVGFAHGVSVDPMLGVRAIGAPLQWNPRGKTVVLFALNQESRPFQRRVEDRKDLDVRTSGMGRKNAEASITHILDEGLPRRVITAGLAGALRPDLVVGDIVFDSSDPSVAKRLIALGAKPVKFTTQERVAVTAEEKRCLRKRTGADVAENESGFIQAICDKRGVPCTTIRVISDAANEDLPFDFNKLQRADGNVDYGKVMAAAFWKPWKIPSLLKFWWHTHNATKKLATFLQQALPQPTA